MMTARSNSKDFARRLLKENNEAEAKLWAHLRNRRLNNYKFVREFPIGPYFADFACRRRKLVAELDGSQHLDSERDVTRDTCLNGKGWSVLRFQASDVLVDISWILHVVVEVLEGRLCLRQEAGSWRFWPAAVNAARARP